MKKTANEQLHQLHLRVSRSTMSQIRGCQVRHGLPNLQAVLPHLLAAQYAVVDAALEGFVLSSLGEATLTLHLTALESETPTATATVEADAEAPGPDLAQIGRLTVSIDRRTLRADVDLEAHPADVRLAGARMHLTSAQLAPGQTEAQRVVRLAHRPLDLPPLGVVGA